MTAISVIIPTYNRPELVSLAIESILAQTHPAAEIIVIDDGSVKDMREVLSRYASKVQIIRQANTGLSGARNTGIRAARHDWIAFLDDDDEHTTDRLERAAESIRRFPNAHVHATNTAIIPLNGPEIDLFKLRGMQSSEWKEVARPLPWVLNGCFFSQSMVIRRQALEQAGLFRKTFYEDMDLFVRLVPHQPWIIDNKPCLRLIRRDNTNAMSDDWRSKPFERCSALVRIHREALALPGLTAAETAQVKDGLASYLFELGIVFSEKQDSAAARKHFAESAGYFRSGKSRAKARAAQWGGRPVIRLLQWITSRRKGFVR